MATANPLSSPVRTLGILALLGILAVSGPSSAGNIAQIPLFIGSSAPPLVMLTVGRDHKLYYEAYNDASDLDGDGSIETRYKPSIDYVGYFDSYQCYVYDSTNGLFNPNASTTTKKCSGSTEWSGDFLNYLTTSRIDALRKVLYGGYRSTDTTTSTVLERSFIPQDAHSWGKEYTNVATDGFDIQDYTPLSLPNAGYRHLFANTTPLTSNPQLPLLRVLTNSANRVWEWLSIEQPVAGTDCATGNNVRKTCAQAGGTFWQLVPASYFANLTQTTYNTTGYSATHPDSSSTFSSLETAYATTGKRYGSGSASQINGSGNPFGSAQDYYLTIFQGNLVIPPGEGGTYTFAVDGDDAVDVIINGTTVAGWYGGHGNCPPTNSGCTVYSGTITLAAGTHTIKFRHQEAAGGDNYYLYWRKTIPTATLTDYTVRVKVCNETPVSGVCKAYNNSGTTIYKPTGLLQDYGEDDSMQFGLITGSYTNNLSGGVLRRNIQSLTDEILATTGQLSGTKGIIKTLDSLKAVGFSNYSYSSNCGFSSFSVNLQEGMCRMWGNPIGEMMYEGLRYFAGKATPTSAFANGVANSGTDDSNLGLPLPAWLDPYSGNISVKYPNGYPACSKPNQLVISDINPIKDTDQVPGGYFNSFSGDLAGFDASVQADLAWNGMGGTALGEKNSESSVVFIGQSGSAADKAPTAKSISGFSTIRGLAPENPSLEGGFYSISSAIHGKTHDMNPAAGDQKVDTLAVVLASPLPKIVIPTTVSGTTKSITLVPFGKTVGGCTANGITPTNQIVDFYVDSIKNMSGADTDSTVNGGRPYGRFRINFEDAEFGADHDMDAIVLYTVALNADNTLSVSLSSDYAAGSCIQHMGYVISGTSRDGVYLEVRDSDTAAASDIDFSLDTPPGQLPGGTWNDGQTLPLTASRTFSIGTGSSAALLKHDPLWYAAKWGGFYDAPLAGTNVGNNKLDADEWDVSPAPNGDGVPDSYFPVTNAGRLKDQLAKAFNKIKANSASASATSTSSTRADTDTLVFQAKFNSGDWSGSVLAFTIDSTGQIIDRNNDGGRTEADAVWNAAQKLPTAANRNIFSYNPAASTASKGIPFAWASLGTAQKTTLVSQDVVNYLRGDQSKEGTTFRSRSVVLGDIVNSDPAFAGAERYGYQTLTEGASGAYFTYLNTKATRNRMLYVGANDGMLHGFEVGKYLSTSKTFDTGSGVESFAYVPNAIIGSPLVTLSQKDYRHKYFVDGSPKVGDAYIGGSWKNVLVGATGAGGRAMFALDVTDPANFSESKVMWEFTNANDADLGYTLPQASIGRMQNGQWAAIVANGYNSDSGKAVLFILNLETGAIIKKIDTLAAGNLSGGVGVAKNGLSTPIIVDKDADRIVDYIYAGDLVGNLWKFDVTSTSTTNWKIAYGTSTAPEPLFVACSATSNASCGVANRQPITAKPQVGPVSANQSDGLMIYVGTGKYFEDGDNVVGTAPQQQSFYGVWDKISGTGTTDQISGAIRGTGALLINQTIDNEMHQGNFDLRAVSASPVNYAAQKGWLIDLKTPPSPGTLTGERVVSAPLLRGSRVIFATLIPLSDPCSYGGTGWLMELDAFSGGRPSDGAPIWDIGGGSSGATDGKIDSNDLITSNGNLIAASGRKSDVGIMKVPSVTRLNDGKTAAEHISGSGGGGPGYGLTTDSSDRGRQGWTQIQNPTAAIVNP